MHLQRIQVPDFRALKDIDISFEKEFTPRIFPLGSQNGGGKSTLLQLIFVLLHCAGNPDRVEFIQNLIDGFYIKDNSGERTLATIDIWDVSLNVKIEFFVGNEDYIFNQFIGSKVDNIELMKYYNFHKKEFISEKISPLQKNKSNIEMVLLNLRHKARKNNQVDSLSTEEQDKEKSIRQEINVIQAKIDKEMALSHEYQNLLNEALKNTQILYICDSYNESNSTVEKLMCVFDGINDINK
ncbi:AAA family ATPase [Trichormus variabilis]|uniref:Rad50/SbcC-type AAA domain-containing protein n=1 Tax=Trichormus variabilis SAG 1403-4b TaxID=447716 RepID=A0A433UEU4_ANAVA|nr:AAA family ATPase [Trichormus variabilis]RUS92312.1 hypothetical protein DSM107003_51190 [Trichormus variabilis SAG 1403-4b]